MAGTKRGNKIQDSSDEMSNSESKKIKTNDNNAVSVQTNQENHPPAVLPIPDLNFLQKQPLDTLNIILDFVSQDLQDAKNFARVNNYFKTKIYDRMRANFTPIFRQKMELRHLPFSANSIKNYNIGEMNLLNEMLAESLAGNKSQQKKTYFKEIRDKILDEENYIKLIKPLLDSFPNETDKNVSLASIIINDQSRIFLQSLESIFLKIKPEILQLICCDFPLVEKKKESEEFIYYSLAFRLGYIIKAKNINSFAVFYGLSLYGGRQLNAAEILSYPIYRLIESEVSKHLLTWMRGNLPRSLSTAKKRYGEKSVEDSSLPMTEAESTCLTFLKNFFKDSLRKNILTKIPLEDYIAELDESLTASLRKKLTTLKSLKESRIDKIIEFYKVFSSRPANLVNLKETFPQLSIEGLEKLNVPIKSANKETYLSKITGMNYVAILHQLCKTTHDKFSTLKGAALAEIIIPIIDQFNKNIDRFARELNQEQLIKVLPYLQLHHFSDALIDQNLLFKASYYKEWRIALLAKDVKISIERQQFYEFLSYLIHYRYADNKKQPELTKIPLRKLDEILSELMNLESKAFERDVEKNSLFRLGEDQGINKVKNILINCQERPKEAAKLLHEIFYDIPQPAQAQNQTVINSHSAVVQQLSPQNDEQSSMIKSASHDDSTYQDPYVASYTPVLDMTDISLDDIQEILNMAKNDPELIFLIAEMDKNSRENSNNDNNHNNNHNNNNSFTP